MLNPKGIGYKKMFDDIQQKKDVENLSFLFTSE